MSAAVGVDLLRATLEAREEPGVAELLDALQTVVSEARVHEAALELTPLKRRVYRLHLNESRAHSVILKRSEPAIAQLNRLVAERWLPALRLGDHVGRRGDARTVGPPFQRVVAEILIDLPNPAALPIRCSSDQSGTVLSESQRGKPPLGD